MAILSHLNSCSSVWKRRAHEELVGGPQAQPQPLYSSGVRRLVTTGVWEVGGLPASGRPCSGKAPTPSRAFRVGSRATPYFSISQTEHASDSITALANASRAFEPVALGWSQSLASPRSFRYSAWSLCCQNHFELLRRGNQSHPSRELLFSQVEWPRVCCLL